MKSVRSVLAFCLLTATNGLVANRSLFGAVGGLRPPTPEIVESSAVPPLSEYSWTAWFSNEDQGYSENRHYAIMGAHCRGGYCDDLQLYQGSSGEVPTSPGSSVWTSWFSEEDTNQRSCPPNHIVTQVQCSGSSCDKKRLRCEMVSPAFNLGTPVWDIVFSLPFNGAPFMFITQFSEEGNGQWMCSHPYGVVTGWSCHGKRCDGQRLQCAPLTPKAWPPQAPATFAWTAYFGSDKTFSPSSHYPITAVSCKGGNCGSLSLYQATSGSDLEVVSSSSHWTHMFSEEGNRTGRCNQDYVVTRVKCSGSRCDNKELMCSKINSEKNVMLSDEFVGATFSEEGSHLGQCPSDGYFVTGMKCFGARCDNLQLLCKKVLPRTQVPSNHAAAPMGMWMNLGQYYQSTPRTTTLQLCTEDSHGQQADRSRTKSFSNEVEMSLLVKQSASVKGLAKVETELGFAYRASTETSTTVAKSIYSSTTQSKCRTEEITCDDKCWDEMSRIQPGTVSASLWQWAVVQQVGNDPLQHHGTFKYLPHGIVPFCPPDMQILGDLTMTQCQPGTFPTQRRLLDPVQWV